MASEPSSSDTIALETLLAELPACNYCRARRRRCDTKLPSCKNCAQTGRDCVFYDHVLNEELPRNYISSLISHLETLRESSDYAVASAQTRGPLAPLILGPFEAQRHSFGFSKGSYRYLARESLLLNLCLPERGPGLSSTEKPSSSIPMNLASRDGSTTPAQHGYLLRLFFGSIHQIYPVLDLTATWLSPDIITSLASHPTQAFIIQMIYAIACRCDQDGQSHLLPIGLAAYGRAMQLLDKTAAEQSTATLQIAILLVLHTMLDPASGNISQQLSFATRLAIDLAGSDSEEEQDTLFTLYKIVYCLENAVYNVLGRPTSLPEPSIPLDMSAEKPLDFLCLLHIMQSRIRRNVPDASLRKQVFNLQDEEEMVQQMHPNILSTLWETRLMLDPSATVARHLVSSYSKDGYTATFLTPFWLHKSVRIILEAISSSPEPPRPELMLGYGKAMALFGRLSRKWETADILIRDIQGSLEVEKSSTGKDRVHGVLRGMDSEE